MMTKCEKCGKEITAAQLEVCDNPDCPYINDRQQSQKNNKYKPIIIIDDDGEY